MKKIVYLFIFMFALNCSNNDDSVESNDNRIEVNINGENFVFNTFSIEKNFENPDDRYYYVTATIDNSLDMVLIFGVQKVGLTGFWEEGELVDEFNLYTGYNPDTEEYSDSTPYCDYYGVDIPYPLINVIVNNEDQLIAEFNFESNYGGSCFGEGTPRFGDQINYSNGYIYLNIN